MRNAERVKNESDKERHRRKEADRIRHQIRRSCYYPENQTVSFMTDAKRFFKEIEEVVQVHPKDNWMVLRSLT